MAQDTKNFKVGEFSCHCGCGFNIIDQRVINIAQKLRDRLGVSVHVNSGCRCEAHNAKVGGVKGSKHTKGLAADLSCSLGAGVMFATIADLKVRGELPELDYGIFYVKKNFVHVDCGGTRNKFFEVRA